MATGGELRPATHLREAGAGLAAQLDVLARAVADEVAVRMGWGMSGPSLRLLAGARALVAELAAALSSGRPAGEVTLSPEAHGLASAAVDAGMANGFARETTRALHRGTSAAAFAGLCDGPHGDPADAASVAALSAWLIDHLGAIEDELERLVGAARETRGAGAAQRAAFVREVLDDRLRMDALPASERLGYDLRRAHVGLLGWAPAGADPDVDAVEAAVEDVARVVGSSWLTIRLSGGLVAAWAVPDDGDVSARIAARRPALEDQGVRLVLSGPRPGVAGFRSVHADVLRAARALTSMGAGPDTAGAICWFDDVRLEALLLADAEAARAFVRAELGELLDDDGDGDRRLLETLEAFLDEDGDTARVAQRLGDDERDVARRLSRIGELLGGPVERRLETRVALRLLRALP